MNKVVFLDRDGTIAEDVPYCSRPEDFKLLPTVGEGLRLLSKSGFKLIVITNQSGVARGYFTEPMLAKIHEKMRADVAEYGGHIDAVYYCPHHPDARCQCRKPNTGMLEQAARDWQINTGQSYFIGDKYLDMEAASRMGCRAVLVPSSEPELEFLQGQKSNGKVDFICRDFHTAAKWVVTDANLMRDVTIIIPTLNEEKNLPYVLPDIPPGTEVILVDGHSEDRTVEVARKLRPDATILYQAGKGKGDALRLGFQRAKGDIIVTFDADGSFDAGELIRFIEPLRCGYDLVKGSRFIKGGGTADMPWHRRTANKGFTFLANLLYGTRYSDLAYGFHAFRKDSLKKIALCSDGFEIDTELYLKAKKAGLKVIEVPSYEANRLSGKGKLRTFPDGWRILKTILRALP